MLEELAEDMAVGKAHLVLLLCALLPVGVTAATAKLEATVQEFRVYRLAHYDFQGTAYGTYIRGSANHSPPGRREGVDERGYKRGRDLNHSPPGRREGVDERGYKRGRDGWFGLVH